MKKLKEIGRVITKKEMSLIKGGSTWGLETDETLKDIRNGYKFLEPWPSLSQSELLSICQQLDFQRKNMAYVLTGSYSDPTASDWIKYDCEKRLLMS